MSTNTHDNKKIYKVQANLKEFGFGSKVVIDGKDITDYITEITIHSKCGEPTTVEITLLFCEAVTEILTADLNIDFVSAAEEYRHSGFPEDADKHMHDS